MPGCRRVPWASLQGLGVSVLFLDFLRVLLSSLAHLAHAARCTLGLLSHGAILAQDFLSDYHRRSVQ